MASANGERFGKHESAWLLVENRNMFLVFFGQEVWLEVHVHTGSLGRTVARIQATILGLYSPSPLLCGYRQIMENTVSMDPMVPLSRRAIFFPPALRRSHVSPQIMVFNRVRRMTNDSSLLIAAMRCSSELEIREQVMRAS